MVTVSMFQNDDAKAILLYEGKCLNKDCIDYFEIETKAYTSIQFLDDGLIMKREDKDHSTLLHLINKNSYGVVESEYGSLPLDVELLEYQREKTVVLARYRLTETFTIKIDFRSN